MESINWDAVSASAEVVGAIAVVLSIAYLARQVRHGVNTIENSAFSETANSWREMLRVSGQYAELFLRGAHDFDALTAVERWQFTGVMNTQFSSFENFFLKHKKGWIDSDQAERWEQVLIWYLAWPGIESWWPEFSQIYTNDFRQHVDDTLDRLKNGTIPKTNLRLFATNTTERESSGDTA